MLKLLQFLVVAKKPTKKACEKKEHDKEGDNLFHESDQEKRKKLRQIHPLP